MNTEDRAFRNGFFKQAAVNGIEFEKAAGLLDMIAKGLGKLEGVNRQSFSAANRGTAQADNMLNSHIRNMLDKDGGGGMLGGSMLGAGAGALGGAAGGAAVPSLSTSGIVTGVGNNPTTGDRVAGGVTGGLEGTVLGSILGGLTGRGAAKLRPNAFGQGMRASHGIHDVQGTIMPNIAGRLN